VSKLFPRGTKLLRTEPLKAMVIGAFVRGLSMRDVESLCDKAGLGKLRQTWGKQIFGVRAVRDNGEPWRFGSAALREVLLKLVTALILPSLLIPIIPSW
jgi:hypothetical protein